MEEAAARLQLEEELAALKALGMGTGISHMEWFRRNDGSVAISEIAARPPGAQFTTLISYAHDFDMYKAWARLLVFEEFTPPRRDYACGIVFLRGQGTGSRAAKRSMSSVWSARSGGRSRRARARATTSIVRSAPSSTPSPQYRHAKLSRSETRRPVRVEMRMTRT